jgi:hypothetical protein
MSAEASTLLAAPESSAMLDAVFNLITAHDIEVLTKDRFPFIVKHMMLTDLHAQLLTDLQQVRAQDTEPLETHIKNVPYFSPALTHQFPHQQQQNSGFTTPVSRDVSNEDSTFQLPACQAPSNMQVSGILTPASSISSAQAPSQAATLGAFSNYSAKSFGECSATQATALAPAPQDVAMKSSRKKSIWSSAGMGKSETAWSNALFRGDRCLFLEIELHSLSINVFADVFAW